jgi:hypothetical protein
MYISSYILSQKKVGINKTIDSVGAFIYGEMRKENSKNQKNRFSYVCELKNKTIFQEEQEEMNYCYACIHL